MTVHAVARRYLQGQTADDIAADITDIPLGHFYAALAFYLSNREQMDAELDEDQREADRIVANWPREQRLPGMR